jgi:hypothetical protein
VRIKGSRDRQTSDPVQSLAYFTLTKEAASQGNEEYLLSFDNALNLSDIWVNQAELNQFNKLR